LSRNGACGSAGDSQNSLGESTRSTTMGCLCCKLYCANLENKKEGMRGVPVSAKKLDPDDVKKRLRQMQGEWRMSLVKCPPHHQNIRMTNDKVMVVGNELFGMSSETGVRGPTQKIRFMQSPKGKLYLDKHGSFVTVWRPEQNRIEINNAMGFVVRYSRPKRGSKSTKGKTKHKSRGSWIVDAAKLQALKDRMTSYSSYSRDTTLEVCLEEKVANRNVENQRPNPTVRNRTQQHNQQPHKNNMMYNNNLNNYNPKASAKLS